MCINFEIPKQDSLAALDKQMKELVEQQRKKQLELPVADDTYEPAADESNNKPKM